MNVLRILGWTIVVAILGFAILAGIGYNMITSGEDFLKEQGAVSVNYIGQNEQAYCTGDGLGMKYLVTGKDNVEFPAGICVDAFGNVSKMK